MVCFTNRALDQFLEELLGIQIPAGSMVRLGGKSTTRTEELSIHKQQIDFRHSTDSWKIIDELRSKSASILVRLRDSFGRYLTARPHKGDIMEHLEFSPDGQRFHTAFKLPTNKDGMAVVGKKGRIRKEFYLIDQWYHGQKAGAFQAHIIESSKDIWELDMSSRRILHRGSEKS